ncbi:BadF/BadG/BcrA/BcrD ATPase family protein [Lichenihabitans psoromatis]|uniref:BadF/BadG/BcrA/BcrD ATPase family protein n=1 Tax=Lichenihabitans psoromatis TaxID=2528642 RepID=UPI001036B012|nr:BadF/BadG/BcrA/BcrD ATPase family protein [Lichenihabitans psoromatis]
MSDHQHTDVPLFLGVDGGGSHCRMRLRDGRGTLLSAVEGGRSNVYLDFEPAIETIALCIDQCLAAGGLGAEDRARLHLGLGLAGVSSRAVADRVAERFKNVCSVTVTNDAEIACLGAHGGKDGGLIIAGTGSAAVARVGGLSTPVGGRGFIMGDDGSGARLGLEALRRALRAHDRLEPQTTLTTSLMAAFDNDPVTLIEWGRHAKSRDFGAFAPQVFEASIAGDPLALSLVHTAAGAIADLARALQDLGAVRISLVGGLASALRPFLPATTLSSLHEPLFDPLEGALLLAGCPLPGADRAP